MGGLYPIAIEGQGDGVFDGFDHHAKVMDAGQRIVEQFFGAKEVVEVSAGKMSASITVTVGIDGIGVGLELFVSDVDPLIGVFAFKMVFGGTMLRPYGVFDNDFAGIEGAVSGKTGRGDAVEHINAQSDSRKNV